MYLPGFLLPWRNFWVTCFCSLLLRFATLEETLQPENKTSVVNFVFVQQTLQMEQYYKTSQTYLYCNVFTKGGSFTKGEAKIRICQKRAANSPSFTTSLFRSVYDHDYQLHLIVQGFLVQQCLLSTSWFYSFCILVLLIHEQKISKSSYFNPNITGKGIIGVSSSAIINM